MDLEINPCKSISGEIEVPSDKSISHRAVMLAGLSDGDCIIENFLESDDCLRTVECFRSMGIRIEKISVPGRGPSAYKVKGKGLKGLLPPTDILYVGNSGTSIRLLLGILAGQDFSATITGDDSIKKRPMMRVVEPLRKMGAVIRGNKDGGYAPIEIKGGHLSAIEYSMPVASAQIKSCLMFAALFASGETKIIEPGHSRDHTEKMFEHFGIPFSKEGSAIKVSSVKSISHCDVNVPGDISSAAFFIVAALIVPGSSLTIKNVGLNPTRTGMIDVLHRMGANLEIKNENMISGEIRADISVKSSKLKGVSIAGDIIPRLIDEIPAIAVAAAFAQGDTVISDAKELRVKESDRIKTVREELGKLGVSIEEKDDGLVIKGGCPLNGAVCESHGDHRIAMSLAVAALASKGKVTIKNTECIETSFPGFTDLLKKVVVS